MVFFPRRRHRLRGLLPARDETAPRSGRAAARRGARGHLQYLPIVVTAGLIVAVAAALVAGELEFFRAFGPGMALTVLVSLAISVTLIPALMAILGSRLYWPRTLAVDERPSRPSRKSPTSSPPGP